MAHRLSPRARADLADIWRHIVLETASETRADRQIDAITTRFSLLAEHPRLGRARNEDFRRFTPSFPMHGNASSPMRRARCPARARSPNP